MSSFTVSAGPGPSIGVKTKFGPVKVGIIAGIKGQGSYNLKDGLSVKAIAEAIAFGQLGPYMLKLGPFYEKTTVKDGKSCNSVEKSGIQKVFVKRKGSGEIQASPWSVGFQLDPFIFSFGANVNLKVLWKGIWE